MDILKHNGGRNGVYLAATAIVLGLVFYLISKELFLNPTLRFILSVALPIYFMRKAALEQREEQEGTISFSEALQASFICLIIGSVIFTVFQVALFYLDTSLLEIQRDIAVETAKSVGGMFGAPEEAMENMEKITAEDLRPKIGTTILSLAQQFIFGFIIAAIISAIVKRG